MRDSWRPRASSAKRAASAAGTRTERKDWRVVADRETAAERVLEGEENKA